jgi:NAD+ synthase
MLEQKVKKPFGSQSLPSYIETVAAQDFGPQELKEKIVTWLKSHLVRTKASGYVFGMSGGIDSSVVSLLVKDAVGDNHLGLILPSDDNPEDIRDAIVLAEKYQIKTKLIDLSSLYTSLLSNLPKSDSLENYAALKGRIRFSILYYFAKNLNYLVVGTVNKLEWSIGYFPKHAVGDVLPIADLLKSEIRNIGRIYGLSEELVNKRASGCSSGSTAEEEWGVSEEELESIVKFLEMGIMPRLDIDRLNNIIARYNSSTHKRLNYPVFMKNNASNRFYSTSLGL